MISVFIEIGLELSEELAPMDEGPCDSFPNESLSRRISEDLNVFVANE